MASRSRRAPVADSSREARYSTLATRPASRPNWCTPISSRSAPVEYGFSAIELNESMTAGSRKTSAPTAGCSAECVHRDHVRIDLVHVDQPQAAAAEWSTTSPPSSCINFVAARRSVTVPKVEEAEAIATKRVDLVIRFSHCQVGQSAGLDVDFGPFHLGAIAIRRAQPRCDVCLVVEPGDDRLIAQTHPRRRRVGQRVEQYGAVGPDTRRRAGRR